MQPPNSNHENVTARPIQTYKISTNNSAYIKKTQHKQTHADIETNKHTTGRTKRKHSIDVHKTKVSHCAGPRVGNHTKNNNMQKMPVIIPIRWKLLRVATLNRGDTFVGNQIVQGM